MIIIKPKREVFVYPADSGVAYLDEETASEENLMFLMLGYLKASEASEFYPENGAYFVFRKDNRQSLIVHCPTLLDLRNITISNIRHILRIL